MLDDGSPDGTGQIADELARQYPGRLDVMHRTGQRGLGRSYRDGFRTAIASDADVVCQMDADLSHDPKFLPSLIAGTADADLVIGSRYIPGGGVENWPFRRVMLSGFANTYIRTVTGLRIHDCTGGFRCWRRGWRACRSTGSAPTAIRSRRSRLSRGRLAPVASLSSASPNGRSCSSNADWARRSRRAAC